jgi:hypothetical protein
MFYAPYYLILDGEAGRKAIQVAVGQRGRN